MITKSQFAFIAAIVAVGFASPALAQSFSPEFGTGNVQAFSYGPRESQPEHDCHCALSEAGRSSAERPSCFRDGALSRWYQFEFFCAHRWGQHGLQRADAFALALISDFLV